jgi:phosphate transport system substrate-binding protein
MHRSVYSVLMALVVVSMVLAACATATAAPTATEASSGAVVGDTATAAPTAAPTALPAGSVQINGAGATFPQPLYAQWTYAYQYVDPAVAINYQGIGSGGGKNAIIANTVDFAGSDSLLSDQNYKDGKDLQMYPMVAGAVVAIYNIKWNTVTTTVGAGTPTPAPTTPAALILNGQVLVDIYNGKVTKWNDPEIVSLNPKLANLLPAAQITAVHRSDGSGTTEIFTKSLTSFSSDWTAGGAQSVEWPVDKLGNGMGGKGNPGVAAAVIATPNSIGYVELDYALANSISFAQMINKAGTTVTANGDSVNAAMADFATTFTDKLTNTIVNAPGTNSWPMAGYTYIILHTTSMTDCVKAQKLVEYLRWTLTDAGAAQIAAKLGYSVLPSAVRDTVLAKLGAVTCNGQPVLK